MSPLLPSPEGLTAAVSSSLLKHPLLLLECSGKRPTTFVCPTPHFPARALFTTPFLSHSVGASAGSHHDLQWVIDVGRIVKSDILLFRACALSPTQDHVQRNPRRAGWRGLLPPGRDDRGISLFRQRLHQASCHEGCVLHALLRHTPPTHASTSHLGLRLVNPSCSVRNRQGGCSC